MQFASAGMANAAGAPVRWLVISQNGGIDIVAPKDTPPDQRVLIDGSPVDVHLVQGVGQVPVTFAMHAFRPPDGVQATILNTMAAPAPPPPPHEGTLPDMSPNLSFDWSSPLQTLGGDGANGLTLGTGGCAKTVGANGKPAEIAKAVSACGDNQVTGRSLDDQAQQLMVQAFVEQHQDLADAGWFTTATLIQGSWVLNTSRSDDFVSWLTFPLDPRVAKVLDALAVRRGQAAPRPDRSPALVQSPGGDVFVTGGQTGSGTTAVSMTTGNQGGDMRLVASVRPATDPDPGSGSGSDSFLNLQTIFSSGIDNANTFLGNTTPIAGLLGDASTLVANADSIAANLGGAASGVGAVEGVGAAGGLSSIGSLGGYVGVGLSVIGAINAFERGDTREGLANVASAAGSLALSSATKAGAAAGAPFGPIGILVGALLGAGAAYAIPIIAGCLVRGTSAGACADKAVQDLKDSLFFLDPRWFLPNIEALISDIFEPDIYIENHTGAAQSLSVHVAPDRTYDVAPAWSDGTWQVEVSTQGAITAGGRPVTALHYETRAAAPWQTSSGWRIQRSDLSAWAQATLPAYGFSPQAVAGFIRSWAFVGEGGGMIDIYPQDRAVIDRVQPMSVDMKGASIQREWFLIASADDAPIPTVPTIEAKVPAAIEIEEWGVLFGHGGRPEVSP